MDVSIIIVSHNTKELTRACLRSVYERTKGVEFEVIAVDNASTDGSARMIKEEFPKVLLLQNKDNLGFGAANNRALAKAKGKYLFYLNSDTVLLNDAAKTFFDYWEKNGDRQNLGALGANLLDADGNIIHSYGRFLDFGTELKNCARAVVSSYAYTILSLFSKRFPPKIPPEKPHEFYEGEVDYINGADLFVKNDSYAAFDERFFLYCEETDLQLKMAKAGKRRLIIDGPKIIHFAGGSSQKPLDKVRIHASFGGINFNLSRVIYFKKNRIPRAKLALLRFLTLAIWLNPLVFKSTKRHIPKLLGFGNKPQDY